MDQRTQTYGFVLGFTCSYGVSFTCTPLFPAGSSSFLLASTFTFYCGVIPNSGFDTNASTHRPCKNLVFSSNPFSFSPPRHPLTIDVQSQDRRAQPIPYDFILRSHLQIPFLYLIIWLSLYLRSPVPRSLSTSWYLYILFLFPFVQLKAFFRVFFLSSLHLRITTSY